MRSTPSFSSDLTTASDPVILTGVWMSFLIAVLDSVSIAYCLKVVVLANYYTSSGRILTAPRSAEVTIPAYALSALEITRFLCFGLKASLPFALSLAKRFCNSSSLIRMFMLLLGMSISMISPSSTNAMGPPEAASGDTCPIESPEVPQKTFRQ